MLPWMWEQRNHEACMVGARHDTRTDNPYEIEVHYAERMYPIDHPARDAAWLAYRDWNTRQEQKRKAELLREPCADLPHDSCAVVYAINVSPTCAVVS